MHSATNNCQVEALRRHSRRRHQCSSSESNGEWMIRISHSTDRPRIPFVVAASPGRHRTRSQVGIRSLQSCWPDPKSCQRSRGRMSPRHEQRLFPARTSRNLENWEKASQRINHDHEKKWDDGYRIPACSGSSREGAFYAGIA